MPFGTASLTRISEEEEVNHTPAKFFNRVSRTLSGPEIERRNSTEMAALLESRPGLQHLVFRRGYLVTDDEDLNLQAFPFLGQWEQGSLRSPGGTW